MSEMSSVVRPEDILGDSENYTNINGITARKGSVAAFLKNIEILENPDSSAEMQTQALDMLKELAPVLKALQFPRYVTFKNKQVQNLFE